MKSVLVLCVRQIKGFVSQIAVYLPTAVSGRAAGASLSDWHS